MRETRIFGVTCSAGSLLIGSLCDACACVRCAFGPQECSHRQRQSASSNPQAKSLEDHIIDSVFTQPGSGADMNLR